MVYAMSRRHLSLSEFVSLDIVNGDLNIEKCSRQDVLFMKKNGQDLFMCVYNNIQFLNNRQENIDALFCTLALLAVEVTNEDVMIDMIRLTFALQVSYFYDDDSKGNAPSDIELLP